MTRLWIPARLRRSSSVILVKWAFGGTRGLKGEVFNQSCIYFYDCIAGVTFNPRYVVLTEL